jgi:uncharacterized protein (TIGR03437 family)
MRIPALFLACSIAPVLLHANVDGTPVGYAGVPDGVPTDHNGAICASCHTGGPPPNAAGRMTLSVTNFSPGVQQNISVQITDTQERLFALQLTARLASDHTQPGGTFAPTPNQTQVLCANGQPGPCGAGVEYVTNLAAAAQPLTPGTKTFSIIWNPPGGNVGPVVFYVTAVAANGDGTPLGDHVYQVSGQQASAAPCSLTGPPAFNSQGAVEDAAAFRSTIASNGLFTIKGSGFFAVGAPGYAATITDLDNGDWPTELGCVSVMVNGTPAPVYYVSNQQIYAQAPNFAASEGADVQVILNPGATNEIKGPVASASAAPVAPALFTFGSSGTGNAAAFDATKNADLADTSVVATGVSASPGDLIELFGTGFGPTVDPLAPGQFALSLDEVANSFSVTIGGVRVPSNHILYVGLAPDPTRQNNAPGLYAVVLVVPQLPAGDQPVTVTVANSSTQGQVTIPIQ